MGARLGRGSGDMRMPNKLGRGGISASWLPGQTRRDDKLGGMPERNKLEKDTPGMCFRTTSRGTPSGEPCMPWLPIAAGPTHRVNGVDVNDIGVPAIVHTLLGLLQPSPGDACRVGSPAGSASTTHSSAAPFPHVYLPPAHPWSWNPPLSCQSGIRMSHLKNFSTPAPCYIPLPGMAVARDSPIRLPEVLGVAAHKAGTWAIKGRA